MCLADLCPIFGCKVNNNKNNNYNSNNNKKTTEKKKSFDDIDSCQERDIERLKYRCEMLSKKCFGDSNVEGKNVDMYKYFNKRVCSNLHCGGGHLEVRGIEVTIDCSILFYHHVIW